MLASSVNQVDETPHLGTCFATRTDGSAARTPLAATLPTQALGISRRGGEQVRPDELLRSGSR